LGHTGGSPRQYPGDIDQHFPDELAKAHRIRRRLHAQDATQAIIFDNKLNELRDGVAGSVKVAYLIW
jgi:hypothetical protein